MAGPYWTRAWNVVTGCTPISPGCERCWAQAMSRRFNPVPDIPDKPGGDFTPTFHADRLDAPLHWRKPQTVFVANMGDLFHEAITDEQRDKAFAVMALAPQHTFLVLTKRPARMRQYCGAPISGTTRRDWVLCEAGRMLNRVHLDGFPDWPLPNVYLGITVCNQEETDRNVPLLLDTPAAHRWLSVEPLLGPVDIRHHLTYNPVNDSGDSHERERGIRGCPGRGAGDRLGGAGLARSSASLEPLDATDSHGRVRAPSGGTSRTGLPSGPRNVGGEALCGSGAQAGLAASLWANPGGSHCESQGWGPREQSPGESRIGDLLGTEAAPGQRPESHPMWREESGLQADGGERRRDQATQEIGRTSGDNSRGLQRHLPDHLEDRSWRPSLDWLIVGGESGPGARPMQPEWALDVYRQCKAAGVPFFFKQWGRVDARGLGDEYEEMERTREHPAQEEQG